MEWIWIVALVAIVIIVITLSPKQAAWEAARQPTSDTLGGITIDGDRIFWGDQSQPLRGVTASVESTGSFTSRTTATRVIAGTLLAGPVGAIVGASAKKNDDRRELYLHVSGPEAYWVARLDPKQGAEARAYAAHITTAARSA